MKNKPINKDWEDKIDKILWEHTLYGTIENGVNNLDIVVINRSKVQDDLVKLFSTLLKQQKQELREKMNKWWEEEGYWSCSANEAVEETLKKLDDILKLL